MSDRDAIFEDLDINDDDINSLYDNVIVPADSLPATRANFVERLFHAWDTYKDRLDEDKKTRYFQSIIVRMVARRDPRKEESIIDRYVGLLGEHGIDVSPYGEGSEAGEGEAEGARAASSAETLAEEEHGLPLGGKAENAPVQRPMPKQTKRRSRSEETNNRGLRGLRDWNHGRAPSETGFRRRRGTDGSVTSAHSLRVERYNLPPPSESTQGNGHHYEADESEISESTRSRRHSFAQPEPNFDRMRFIPPGLLERSLEQLEIDADVFQQTKDRVAQRRLMWAWSRRAAQLRAEREQLEIMANNHDRAKLLHDALVAWRTKLDGRRQNRVWQETERFYAELEQSAVRERSMNLKWVAFTHWEQLAKEQKARTATARRHVLRRKYWNAWNSVTAVNELKVRRFILRRFFNLWENRLREQQDRALRALAFDQVKLLQKCYNRWAYACATRTVPLMKSIRLGRHYIQKWKEIAISIRERDIEVELMRDRHMVRKLLEGWARKAKAFQDMDGQARNFRRQRLLTQPLHTWRREASMKPKAELLYHHHEERLVRGIFSNWCRGARLSREASQVHDQRVLQKAFTLWNDQLRVQFLQGQIASRLQAEAFYKWILQTRSKAADLNYRRRLASDALYLWLSKADHRQRSIEGAEATFAAAQRRRILLKGLFKIFSAYQRRQHLEDLAQEFRCARLLSTALARWRAGNATVQLLYAKSRAAEFYMQTTKSLKRWSAVTEEHRRIRRREAYHVVRRMCKRNMAEDMIRRWQIRLAHVRNMERHAVNFGEDRMVNSTVTKLRKWKDKAMAHVQQDRQAADLYRRRILESALQALLEEYFRIRDLDAQAREFSAGMAAVEALTCFKKLDRRLFQIKGQEQWANALREKHWEKHVRNMLRYWCEQALARHQQYQSRQSQLSKHQGDDGEDDDEGNKRPASATKHRASQAPPLEDLSIFDTTTWNPAPLDLNLHSYRDTHHPNPPVDLDVTLFEDDPDHGITTSTPLPGYLRTPSKRSTARAAARSRAAISSTRLKNHITRFALPGPSTTSPPPRPPPSRGQPFSAPTIPPSPAPPRVTPFETKLREKGYPVLGLAPTLPPPFPSFPASAPPTSTPLPAPLAPEGSKGRATDPDRGPGGRPGSARASFPSRGVPGQTPATGRSLARWAARPFEDIPEASEESWRRG